MKVSERGQITIPKELREKFGFGADTEVDFVVKEDGLHIVKKTGQRAPSIEQLYGIAKFEKTTDELMKLLRE